MPENPASLLSEAVYGLNKIEGVEARGIVFKENMSIYQSNKDLIVWNRVYGSNYNPFILGRRLILLLKFTRQVIWADVIHWYWDSGILPYNLDLRIIRFFKKPLFIEWVGSEIRNAEIESKINSYYKEALDKGYEYAAMESGNGSMQKQHKFSEFNAYPVLGRGGSTYYHVDKALFKKVFLTNHRINTDKYLANFPGSELNTPPLIIHSPTARIAKGSNHIQAAINILSKKHRLKFELLEKLSRDEVKQKMMHCDIYIDQLIVGGHGMAATEAMAMGKPVVCYLHANSIKELPDDCPIINASIDTLVEQLEKLIVSPSLRNDIGKRSRVYVEKYLDSKIVAKELLEMYESVMDTR